jgi:hypothetical protein
MISMVLNFVKLDRLEKVFVLRLNFSQYGKENLINSKGLQSGKTAVDLFQIVEKIAYIFEINSVCCGGKGKRLCVFIAPVFVTGGDTGTHFPQKVKILLDQPFIGGRLRIFQFSSKFIRTSCFHIPHDFVKVEQSPDAVFGDRFGHII